MKRLPVLCFALSALLGAPQARAQEPQALSLSMVECAVIYNVIGKSAKARERPEKMVKTFQDMSSNFMDAAAAQAEAEGVDDVSTYITQIYEDVSPAWEEKLGTILELPDTLEWIRYCGALAHDRGLVPE